MDEDGEDMEDSPNYNCKKEWGRIPRNTRIELAYQLTGTTMGLLGECNALISKVLEGEYVSAYTLRDYLDNVARLTSVIGTIVNAEAFDKREIPF